MKRFIVIMLALFTLASCAGMRQSDMDVAVDVGASANSYTVESAFDPSTDYLMGITDYAGSWAVKRIDLTNFATTGDITGAINIVTTTDGTESPTAAQMYGTFFIAANATAANDTDYTLPTAVAGMSACFYDNGGGDGGIIIDANTDDAILLNGATVGTADAIDSPGVAGAGANGDFICILAIDATNWITLGASGTWVDGGAD